MAARRGADGGGGKMGWWWSGTQLGWCLDGSQLAIYSRGRRCGVKEVSRRVCGWRRWAEVELDCQPAGLVPPRCCEGATRCRFGQGAPLHNHCPDTRPRLHAPHIRRPSTLAHSCPGRHTSIRPHYISTYTPAIHSPPGALP